MHLQRRRLIEQEGMAPMAPSLPSSQPGSMPYSKCIESGNNQSPPQVNPHAITGADAFVLQYFADSCCQLVQLCVADVCYAGLDNGDPPGMFSGRVFKQLMQPLPAHDH